MNCEHLAEKIQSLRPDADARDVARLCLLMCNAVGEVEALDDPARLHETWSEVAMRLQAATDQHAAMTEELDGLAASDPLQFSPEQIWILIRAIKVQSQILEMYLGENQLASGE